MNFKQLLETRYTAKVYRKNAALDGDTLAEILECARLTPSSVNIQPWKFILLTGAAKDRLLSAIKEFNRDRFSGAGAALVIAAKTALGAREVRAVCEREKLDGRYATDELMEARYRHTLKAVEEHNRAGDTAVWAAKQAYIALGTVLYAAAALKVDSTPLEGFYRGRLNELLNLDADSLDAQAVVLLGRADPEDFNRPEVCPKSRLPLK